MRKNQCPRNRQQDRESTKTGNGEKVAELCRMSCCAVAWRAGRERRADSWRRGGHSSRSDNAMRKMDIGFWKPGFQVVSVCPPRSPGRFLAPSGTGLVTLSNRTDSATVDRSTPAPIPPHHHISMEAKLFSDRESGGELAGSCIFCGAFLGFLPKPRQDSFSNTVSPCMSSFSPFHPPQAAQCRVGHCLAGDVLARIKEAGRCGWKRVWWKPSLRSLGKRKSSGSEKSGISESLAFMFLLIWVTRRRGDHQAPVRRPLPLDHTRLEIPS